MNAAWKSKLQQTQYLKWSYSQTDLDLSGETISLSAALTVYFTLILISPTHVTAAQDVLHNVCGGSSLQRMWSRPVTNNEQSRMHLHLGLFVIYTTVVMQPREIRVPMTVRNLYPSSLIGG
jgi:hypothetical protein